MTRLADKTVLTLYLNNGTSEDRPPPSIVLRAKRRLATEPGESKSRKPHHYLSSEAKWQVLVDAREARADPETVLRLKKSEAEYGCHWKSAEAWMRKEQSMYTKRTSIGLSCGASHASYPPSRAPHIILICCNNTNIMHIIIIYIYIYIIIFKSIIS